MPKNLYAGIFKWFWAVLPGEKQLCIFLKNKYGFQTVWFKRLLNQLICLSLKTKDIHLKTKHGLLKAKDSLLKTEDVLLKTEDGCTFFSWEGQGLGCFFLIRIKFHLEREKERGKRGYGGESLNEGYFCKIPIVKQDTNFIL